MIIKPTAIRQKLARQETKQGIIKNQSISCIPVIPKDLVIIRDNNEQKPYEFSDITGLKYIDKSIDCGDYTIQGYEGEIVIERKGVNDFYSSITHNRDRFDRMWDRCKNAKFKGLLIEAKEDELYCPEMSWSGVNPNSVYGSIIGFEIKNNVHVYCNTREMCMQRLIHWLVKFYKEKKEEMKNKGESK